MLLTDPWHGTGPCISVGAQAQLDAQIQRSKVQLRLKSNSLLAGRCVTIETWVHGARAQGRNLCAVCCVRGEAGVARWSMVAVWCL